MPYYHDLITDKSWQLLQQLRKKYNFILIGGWAVYLYTKALKSKDIDLVLEYGELGKIKEEFELSKNNRLKKYEARKKEVEIDIYVPYYSNPGLPAEEIGNFATNVAGFKVIEKEILAVLKQRALKERAHSVKGKKDLIDLVSLFSLDNFDWQKYGEVIKQYRLEEYSQATKRVLKEVKVIEELNLNPHKLSRLKKKILPLL